MHEGSRLKCLAWLFLRQPLGRQFAQLIVNQRQKLFGSSRIALFDGRKNARDIGH